MKDQNHYTALVGYVASILDERPFNGEVESGFVKYLLENKMPGLARRLEAEGRLSKSAALRLERWNDRIETRYAYAAKVSGYIIKNRLRCFLAKGFLLGHQIYGDIRARGFGDIDFFCARGDITQLCGFIESLGFENGLLRHAKESVIFDEPLRRAHYENDNENGFWNERDDCYIEVKLGDYVSHGGFDEAQIEAILGDEGAVVQYRIGEDMFPSLNEDYTLLMLISNTYRNFNTHTGQILDFKIRDLVDLCFALKKAGPARRLRERLWPLLKRFNKVYEFLVVLKYCSMTFHSRFVESLLADMQLLEPVQNVKLYTECSSMERFFCDRDFRVAQMEAGLRERIKRRIDAQYPCDYFTRDYPLRTSVLFHALSGNRPASLRLQNDKNGLTVQIAPSLHTLPIPVFLEIEFCCFGGGLPENQYTALLSFSNGTAKLLGSLFDFQLHIREDGAELCGTLPEGLVYNGWVAFHADCYIGAFDWSCHAGNLGRPYYPVLYRLD